jgi:DNA-binding transcriptional ArsR family regulator
MVNYKDPALDRTFAALADPTRRALLARLGRKSHSISELAAPLSMSLPAVMKHLAVLADAGLVTRKKSGRTVACTLNAAPMRRATAWLERYRQQWEARLDHLDNYLQRLVEEES